MFFTIGASLLSVDMFAGPLTSKLMQADIWTPIFLGFLINIPAVPLAFALPETMNAAQVPGEVPSDLEDAPPEVATGKGVVGRVRDSLARLRTAALFVIWGNKSVALLLTTLLTTMLGKNAQELLAQFARKKLSWTWAEVRAHPLPPRRPAADGGHANRWRTSGASSRWRRSCSSLSSSPASVSCSSTTPSCRPGPRTSSWRGRAASSCSPGP